jgi:hypothetical protein
MRGTQAHRPYDVSHAAAATGRGWLGGLIGGVAGFAGVVGGARVAWAAVARFGAPARRAQAHDFAMRRWAGLIGGVAR